MACTLAINIVWLFTTFMIYIYTVPYEGGVYLVLQGVVQEISKNEQTGAYKTKTVSLDLETQVYGLTCNDIHSSFLGVPSGK